MYDLAAFCPLLLVLQFSVFMMMWALRCVVRVQARTLPFVRRVMAAGCCSVTVLQAGHGHLSLLRPCRRRPHAPTASALAAHMPRAATASNSHSKRNSRCRSHCRPSMARPGCV
jgi:hypothetical protein